jgi:hypothetical protein
MNPARQFLHILLKDIRCHALEIGVVLVLNVALGLALTETWAESLPGGLRDVDPMFGAAAQLLLVVAWCVLIGRVVQADGVAGNASYCLARPYSRMALLASKLVFVLLFVHLPLLLSHLAIVTGSDLPLSLAQMLVDQAVLAACVSLPAMTVAALTTSFSRYVFGGIAVAAVANFAVAASSARSPLNAIGDFPPSPGSHFVVATALAMLAAIAGVALVCQYRRRATLRVAVSSVVALSLLGLVLLTLPTFFVMRVRAAVTRPATVATTIRFRETAEPSILDRELTSDRGFVLVLLPLDLSDTDESTIYTFKVDIRGAAGREHELRGVRTSGGSYGASIRGTIYGGDDVDGDGWLDLRLSPSDYDSLKDDLVSVHFIAEIETYEFRETESIPRDGNFAIVDGRAQCGVAIPLSYAVCRSSSGWTQSSSDLSTGAEQWWLPVRLRFEINPIVTARLGNGTLDEVTTPEIPTRVRRHVSYTRQDVTFENIRLGDWGPP